MWKERDMNRKALAVSVIVAAALIGTSGCRAGDPLMVASAPSLPGQVILETSDLNSVPEEPWWTVRTSARGSSPTPQAGPGWTPQSDPPETTVQVPSDLLFNVGSSQLSPAARSQLASVAQLAADHPTAIVTITGFTDSDGSEASNQVLSLERAQAVADWLEGEGVSPKRLIIEGKGERHPEAPNDTPEHKALNRRVEITVG